MVKKMFALSLLLFMVFYAVLNRHVHTRSVYVKADRQVVTLKNAVNWSQDVLGCQELGPVYSTPVIRDTTDLQALEQAMTSSKVNRAWLTLKREKLPTLTWLDGSSYNGGIEEHSVSSSICGIVLIREPALEVDKCTVDQYGYICEGNGTCSTYPVSPVNCVVVRERAYAYGCVSYSWYDARNKCKQLKMDLAVLKEKEVRQYLKTQWLNQNQKYCTRLWTGLRKEEWLQQGTRLPGSVLPPWAPGQPSAGEECTIMATGGISGSIWQSSNCAELNTAICIANSFVKLTQPVSRNEAQTRSYSNSDMTITTSADKVNPTTKSESLSGGAISGIVMGLIVFVFIQVLILYIFRRITHQKFKNRTPSPTPENDIVHRSNAESLQPLINVAETGLTALLATELNKITEGPASRDEITLRIYVLQACSNHDLSFEDLVKGVIVRRDLQLDLPRETDKEFTLNTELFVDDKTIKIKGISSKEMKMSQVLAKSGAFPGRLITEFIITGNGKQKLQNFRTNITFSWKADSNTTVWVAEYSDVIERDKIKQRQASHERLNKTRSLGSTPIKCSRENSVISFSSEPVQSRRGTMESRINP